MDMLELVRGIQMNNLNISIDATGKTPVFGSGKIITSLKQCPVIIPPGKNRRRLDQSVDRFIKTLIKSDAEGDIPTHERLEDADIALIIATKLQETAKKLFEQAKKGITDIKERPFDEEHPKMTVLENQIVELGRTVENKIKATEPLVIPMGEDVLSLITLSKTDKLNRQAGKIAELEEKLHKTMGENSRLIHSQNKIGEAVAQVMSGKDKV